MKHLIIESADFERLSKFTVHSVVNKLSQSMGFFVKDLVINFVSETKITSINKEYLKHDYSTDIITFNYSERLNTLEGEIYISYSNALDNAEKFGVKYSNEILRLIIHGILHMLGHNDIKTSEKNEMRLLEDKYLAELNSLEKNLLR